MSCAVHAALACCSPLQCSVCAPCDSKAVFLPLLQGMKARMATLASSLGLGGQNPLGPGV